MSIKYFNSSILAFVAIVTSLVLSGGCAAQTAATQVRTQGAEATHAAAVSPALMDPSLANETAPDKFQAKFTTTKGDFVVEVTRAWAPNGADRFYNMCRSGYFKDIAIFRSIKDFMFQFGIHGDPRVSAKWMDENIKDDPSVQISNVPGTLSFAQTGRPNSRSVQMFVNTGNNTFLDKAQGGGAPFVPFGRIISGMNVVGKIHVTGENDKEVQGNFQQRGNDYIKTKYPNLDFIRSVQVSITN